MKYLDYSEMDHIKAPIFQTNVENCEIQSTFQYTKEGHRWIPSKGGNNIFSLEYDYISETGELKVNNVFYVE